MTNSTAKALAGDASKSNELANEALNTINQSTTDKGVYDALYQLSEAVGTLATAIVALVDRSDTPV